MNDGHLQHCGSRNGTQWCSGRDWTTSTILAIRRCSVAGPRPGACVNVYPPPFCFPNGAYDADGDSRSIPAGSAPADIGGSGQVQWLSCRASRQEQPLPSANGHVFGNPVTGNHCFAPNLKASTSWPTVWMNTAAGSLGGSARGARMQLWVVELSGRRRWILPEPFMMYHAQRR